MRPAGRSGCARRDGCSPWGGWPKSPRSPGNPARVGRPCVGHRRGVSIPTEAPMDATAASIGLNRDEFLLSLGASRLLTPEDLNRLAVEHPGENAVGLANALLSNGTLNDYQLDALVQGRAGELRIGNYDVL